MSIVLVGSTSGSCTLQEQAVAGTTVLTLPTTSGTVSLDGPAFSAYNNNTQAATIVVFTKVQLNSEEFDTNNNFDSTTNYRFTPTVAGYYQIQGTVAITGTATLIFTFASIYKNGSEFKRSRSGVNVNAGGADSSASVSSIIYFNGSTDYVELYAYYNAGGNAVINSNGAGLYTYFSGSMVRAA